MQKLAVNAKNKALFYLVTFVAAIFLTVTIAPNALAQADTTPPDDVENLQIEVYDEAVF